MTESADGWDLEVRPQRVKYAAYAAAAVIVVVHVAVGALLKLRATGVIFQTSDQIAMAVLGFILAGLVLLFTRSRLRAGPAGISIRNVVSDKLIPWQDVAGVSFPVGARWARIDLPDDEYVPAMAIQSVDKVRAVTAMDELRALVVRYRPDLSSAPASS
ncbi:MAG: PH domain-containing protein [Mycobacterium sp.]